MRVAEVADDRTLKVVERDKTPLEESQVRIDVAYCGICGSDLQMRSDADFPSKSVLGHEFSGSISEVGENVADWSVGDRVVVLPNHSCGGRCRHCAEGYENFCVDGGHLGWVLGVQGQGGLADSVVAPTSSLFAVPDTLGDKAAALTEPTAVAVHAANRVNVGMSEPIVVLGAGPVGLLVAAILRKRGFRELLVIERNESRRAVAERIGFKVADTPSQKNLSSNSMDQALSPTSSLPSELVDKLSEHPAVVVDATGSPAAIQLATQLVRNRGTLLMVGLPGEMVELDLASVILHEIDLLGAAGYTRKDFSQALELLASGEIPYEEIITEVSSLENATSRFQELGKPGTSQLKIMIQP